MKKLLRMALFAALPLAAMMMFSSYSDGWTQRCPPPGHDFFYTVLLPNPENCSTFFVCSNGIPILMRCPDGLVFNDELDVCEFPSSANPCDGSGNGGGSYPGGGGSNAGTCCSYAWTGDSVMSVCWVSKAKALENYNWWNTSDKAWCCDSCRGLDWVRLECGS